MMEGHIEILRLMVERFDEHDGRVLVRSIGKAISKAWPFLSDEDRAVIAVRLGPKCTTCGRYRCRNVERDWTELRTSEGRTTGWICPECLDDMRHGETVQ
jgi:hypothetical protein